MSPLVLLALFAPDPTVQGLFVPVSARTPGRKQAVVLIHGLGLHPLSTARVTTPALRTWQQPTSALVKALSRHADVFAFAYGQTAPAEKVADASGLAGHLKNLQADGYTEIVLVGHSAGGLIARHLIEDGPACGVTRCVQVCTPNAGSGLTALAPTREAQGAFVASLSRGAREKVLAARLSIKLPATVEFACVVASMRVGGDGVVALASQWSEDLQKQGVPAYLVHAGHKDVLTGARGIEAIVKAATLPATRWDAEKVSAARKAILGR